MGKKPEDMKRDEVEGQVRRMNLNPYQRREPIGRGRDHWAMHNCASRGEFDAYLLLRRRLLELMPNARMPAMGLPVVAFVNDNRWMARCECGGLGVVDWDDPSFWCHRCMNKTNGQKPRPIFFPPGPLRHEIDGVLRASDDPLWRNFSCLAEDQGEPGSARSNRLPSKEEIELAVIEAMQANLLAGLPIFRSPTGSLSPARVPREEDRP